MAIGPDQQALPCPESPLAPSAGCRPRARQAFAQGLPPSAPRPKRRKISPARRPNPALASSCHVIRSSSPDSESPPHLNKYKWSLPLPWRPASASPYRSPEKEKSKPAKEKMNGHKINSTMRAVVFNGPRKIDVEERPRPTLRDATDAIVKVKLAGVCGSELHMYRGHQVTEAGHIMVRKMRGVDFNFIISKEGRGRRRGGFG